MKTDISFCPICAGKLDAGEEEQFNCEECEVQFFIQVVDTADEDGEEEAAEEEEEEEEEL